MSEPRCPKHDWRYLYRDGGEAVDRLTYSLKGLGDYTLCAHCRRVGVISRGRTRRGVRHIRPIPEQFGFAARRRAHAAWWNAGLGTERKWREIDEFHETTQEHDAGAEPDACVGAAAA